MRRHLPGMAVGFALGLLSNAFAFALGDDEAFTYRAILLAGIAWVYFGFAVADGRRDPLALAWPRSGSRVGV